MATSRVLVRWHTIRLTIRVDTERKSCSVEPDEDDIEDCDPLELVRFWLKVAKWGVEFEKKRPNWKLNGSKSRSKVDDQSEKFYTVRV